MPLQQSKLGHMRTPSPWASQPLGDPMFHHGGTSEGDLGATFMTLNEIVSHRPLDRGYPERKVYSGLPMASEYKRATDERTRSATGHCDLGSVAFTISPRCCRASPYTSSGVLRFTDMLLSLRPFRVRLVVHLEVISPELRPSPRAILSVRTTAHTFTAQGSPPVVRTSFSVRGMGCKVFGGCLDDWPLTPS